MSGQIPVVVQAPTPVSVNAQNPTFTFGNPTVVGNLLVIFFNWANTSGAVSGVADQLNGAWTQIDFQQPASSVRTQYTFAVKVKAAGIPTVTVSTDSARVYTASLYEAQGVLITLDGTPVHTFTTTAGTSGATGTLTTIQPNSLVFISLKGGTVTTTPATPPWTDESITNHVTGYQVGTNPGPYSASWTFASSTYAATILAFQAAPSGPGPTFVQGVTVLSTTGGVMTLTVPNVKAGDSLFIINSWYNGAGASAPTDNNGQSYAQFQGNIVSGVMMMNAFWLQSSNGGTVVITMPFVAAFTIGMVLEYSPVTGLLTPVTGNLNTANFTIGPLTTANPNLTLLAACVSANAGATITAPSGYFTRTTGFLAAHLFSIAADTPAPNPGAYSAAFSQAGSFITIGFLTALQGPVPPPTSPVATTPADNRFTLLAKSNQALGGSGTTPSDNEFTLLAKQFRLLGGAGAGVNSMRLFILLARINQKLGGSGTTPSDNVFTLLAKQNRLLGGSGAVAGDTVFTLLAKNAKLFHH